MGRVRASVDLPGPASEAEALWYDHRRWPAFVDGLKNVARVTGDWPHAGAEILWDSHPGGRGRVLERVLEHEARRGQVLAVEDERIRATQRVGFASHERGVVVGLELDYELKDPRLNFAPIDLLFIRRRQRDALQRTLRRFAAELRAEREPAL